MVKDIINSLPEDVLKSLSGITEQDAAFGRPKITPEKKEQIDYLKKRVMDLVKTPELEWIQGLRNIATAKTEKDFNDAVKNFDLDDVREIQRKFARPGTENSENNPAYKEAMRVVCELTDYQINLEKEQVKGQSPER